MSRFQFVAAEKVNYSVVRLCHVLEVSTSGFYAWQRHQPSHRARVDEDSANASAACTRTATAPMVRRGYTPS